MYDYDEPRYQVFVSSTFRDLKEEREKVLQAILEIKAFPSGMELFPSADAEQFDFIKREIESSDYYLVIIAGKYGSLASDGISFTEKEYDLAVELGKPVIGFLYHDLDDLKGAYLEEDPVKRARVVAFREKIAARKLVRLYRNADELKTQVWHALSHTFKLQPGQGWVRAKNASRIEDLRQITTLQQRLMELEMENSSLRAAASQARRLASGADFEDWVLTLKTIDEGEVLTQQANVQTTWDDLFLACFESNFPRTTLFAARSNVSELLIQKLPERGITRNELERVANLDSIVSDIKCQFLGLGLIDTSLVENLNEIWNLTEEGKLRLALLRGRTRQ